MITSRRVSRRALLGAAAASLAAPHVARAKTTSIVVASSGGKLEEAFTAAYYKPFTAKTGIEIVSTTNTYSKLKAMVDAGAVEWDVAQIDSAAAATNAMLGLLEKLDYGVIDKTDLIEGVPHDNYIPCDVAAAVMSWNTKNVKPAEAPQSWAELWDMKRFNGQRGFWKQPFQTMEIALMADGVTKDKLYPIDVERALKSLDRIKSQIFWWSSGGQSAQILIDGDIAAGMSWNGRVFDPKQSGAPVDFNFNQALFVAEFMGDSTWLQEQGSGHGLHRIQPAGYPAVGVCQGDPLWAGEPQSARAAGQAAPRSSPFVGGEFCERGVPEFRLVGAEWPEGGRTVQ